MHTRTLIVLAALALSGCDKDEATKNAPAADPHAAFTDVSVDDVDKMLTDKKCVAVDANSSDTREKYGVVPGAVQLTSYEKFATSELPNDKGTKLVFYCGSEACTAAPKAAKLASEAGYSDVNVMRAGIRGWVKAGKKVETPKG
jgi:rhodanese-related sulfurtransferase